MLQREEQLFFWCYIGNFLLIFCHMCTRGERGGWCDQLPLLTSLVLSSARIHTRVYKVYTCVYIVYTYVYICIYFFLYVYFFYKTIYTRTYINLCAYIKYINFIYVYTKFIHVKKIQAYKLCMCTYTKLHTKFLYAYKKFIYVSLYLHILKTE